MRGTAPRAHPHRAPATEGMAVRSLSAGYRRRDVIHEVDLDAAAGHITALVGPNGAGKSTLLKAAVGLVPPSQGAITLDGQPVAERRGAIAYLPQRAALDWDFPAQVRDVVALGRYPRRRLRLRTQADRTAVAAAIERVGLGPLAHRPIRELSGGERQRALLARAFAQEAPVLALDEPFDGVDAASERVLVDQLRAAADDGAVVVVVHHDLRGVARLADHVVVLAGRVLASGPPRATLTPATVARAYAGLEWDGVPEHP